MGDVSPGDPANDEREPRSAREGLFALWLGEAGAGATTAGCAEPARVVRAIAPGQPAVWYAIGRCGAELRSLGVYTNDGHTAILLQQAARFAAAAAQRGTLIGASDRQRVGAGDLYVLQTVEGSEVVSRPRQSTGPLSPAGSGTRPCERFTSSNVSYSLTPPLLVPLWLDLMRRGFGWTWPESEGPISDEIARYKFITEDGNVVARAECIQRRHCILTTSEGSIENSVPGSVTLEELLVYAPSPVS